MAGIGVGNGPRLEQLGSNDVEVGTAQTRPPTAPVGPQKPQAADSDRVERGPDKQKSTAPAARPGPDAGQLTPLDQHAAQISGAVRSGDGTAAKAQIEDYVFGPDEKHPFSRAKQKERFDALTA